MNFRSIFGSAIAATFVALSTSALSPNAIARTAARICTRCSEGVAGASDESSPLDAKNLKTIQRTDAALSEDFARKSCEQIVNSPECQAIYAAIKKSGRNPKDYEPNCNESTVGRIIDGFDGFEQGGNEETLRLIKSFGLGLINIPMLPVSLYRKYEKSKSCNRDLKAKEYFFYVYNSHRPKDLQVKMPTTKGGQLNLAWFNTETCSSVKDYIQMMGTEKWAHKLSKAHAKFLSFDQELAQDFYCYSGKKTAEVVSASVVWTAANITPESEAAEATEAVGDVARVGKIEDARDVQVVRNERAEGVLSPDWTTSPVSEIHLSKETLHLLSEHVIDQVSPELESAVSDLRAAQENIGKVKNARSEDVMRRRLDQEQIISEIEKERPAFKDILARKTTNSVILGKNIEDIESIIGHFVDQKEDLSIQLHSPISDPILREAHAGDDFMLQTNYYMKDGKKYGVEMYVCAKPRCVKDGETFERGSAFTVYFTCGPDVLVFKKGHGGAISVRLSECS